ARIDGPSFGDLCDIQRKFGSGGTTPGIFGYVANKVLLVLVYRSVASKRVTSMTCRRRRFLPVWRGMSPRRTPGRGPGHKFLSSSFGRCWYYRMKYSLAAG